MDQMLWLVDANKFGEAVYKLSSDSTLTINFGIEMYRAKILLGAKVCVPLLMLCLSGCIAVVVGAVVDTTIEVAKVPFKVAGAAVDVIVPDDNEDN
jgi:hypothetical protein|tara:strand:- start:334 stop:621 length:288 start_codon:yes stop_codon:yes gene_type:complete